MWGHKRWYLCGTLHEKIIKSYKSDCIAVNKNILLVFDLLTAVYWWFRSDMHSPTLTMSAINTAVVNEQKLISHSNFVSYAFNNCHHVKDKQCRLEHTLWISSNINFFWNSDLSLMSWIQHLLPYQIHTLLKSKERNWSEKKNRFISRKFNNCHPVKKKMLLTWGNRNWSEIQICLLGFQQLSTSQIYRLLTSKNWNWSVIKICLSYLQKPSLCRKQMVDLKELKLDGNSDLSLIHSTTDTMSNKNYVDMNELKLIINSDVSLMSSTTVTIGKDKYFWLERT